MSLNTISFWIRFLISHTYQSANDEDYKAVKVDSQNTKDRSGSQGRLTKKQKIDLSLFFRKSCAVQQVMKAGT